MKKIISLITCFLILLSAAACSSDTDTASSSSATTSSRTVSSKASVSSKVNSSSKASSSQSGVEVGMTIDQVLAKMTGTNVSKEMYQHSITNEGNKARLKALFEKAKRGENITVAALGGSITEGAGADSGKAYSDQVMNWFSSTFPNATVNKKKAGVGGTPSTLGVFRMEKDILAYNPDFVIIDFSVNDSLQYTPDDYKEAYEGIIRKLLNAPKQPAIICIGFTRTDKETYSTFSNTQSIHVPLAQRYGIPYISYQDAIAPEVQSGRLQWSTIASKSGSGVVDTVHPSTIGATVAADLVKCFLTYNYSNLSKITDTALTTPAPLTGNKYENAKFYNNTDLNATLSGFSKISDAYNSVEGLKNGWRTTTVGSTIEFAVNAKLVRICYIKSKNSSAGGIVEKFKNGSSQGTFDSENNIDFDMIGFTTIYDGAQANNTYKLSLKSGERFTLVGVMVLE